MSDALPAAPNFWRAVGITFETCVRNVRTCIALVLPYAILSGLAVATAAVLSPFDPTKVSSETIVIGASAVAAIGTRALVFVLVLPITLGALSLVGSAAVYGDAIDLSGTLRRAIDRALESIAVLLIVALIFVAPVIVIGLIGLVVGLAAGGTSGFATLYFVLVGLIPAYVYVGVRLSLAVTAVMREGLGPTDAIRRSWRLVHGAWWWVFGVLVIVSIVSSALGGIFSFGVTRPLGEGGPVDFVLRALAATISNVISTSIVGVMSGVVYATRALPSAAAASSGAPEHPLPSSD